MNDTKKIISQILSLPENFRSLGNNKSLVDNYRNSAGLPDVNTGRFVIEGTTKRIDVISSRPALELDGNQGGIKELLINPKNVMKSTHFLNKNSLPN